MRFATGRLHQAHALRVAARNIQKRRVHASVEVLAGALHAVGTRAARGARKAVGRAAAGHQQDGAIGHQALAGERVRRVYKRAVKPAAVTLISHGGVGKAVAQHHGAARKRRHDHFADQLRARRLVDEQLGRIAHVHVFRAEHHAAQLFAHVGAARLAQAHNLAAHGGKRVGQKADVRGLARPVAAFERDEHAALGRFGRTCRDASLSRRNRRSARGRDLPGVAHRGHFADDAGVVNLGHGAIPARRRPRPPPPLPRRAGRTARA